MNEPSPPDKHSPAIVCTAQQLCPSCGRAFLSTAEAPALQITTVERKVDGITSTGRIPMAICPVCGMAIIEIDRVVPIELRGLTCKCGGHDFRFSIRSIKPNRVKEPTDWNFELDVVCTLCDRQRFHQLILNFFRIKKIKLGASGVEIEMLPSRKS